MLHSNFMVMSFPFITAVEINEKKKKLDMISLNKINTELTNSSDKKPKTEPKKSETSQNNSSENTEKENMICLSNLEEVVFYKSSPKRTTNKSNSERKNSIPLPFNNYDKYLDFFE